MARLTQSTVRTVRFYEQEGLLNPTERRCGGNRMFTERELSKLRLILALREAELSLGDIRELFALKASCKTANEASGQMASLLERQIQNLQEKIVKLRSLRGELASTVAFLDECRSCPTVQFPKDCVSCDALKRTDLPRAVHLLWG